MKNCHFRLRYAAVWLSFLVATLLYCGFGVGQETPEPPASGAAPSPVEETQAEAPKAGHDFDSPPRPEADSAQPSAFPGDKTVFVALVRSIDSFFDALELTLKSDKKSLASFALNRDFLEETMTQDGPDFARPFGLVFRKGPQGLFPIFFIPVTDNIKKLNNIILLPQIFQQVKDEYGPTNRYKVRQDIAVLGGLHYFYWAEEQLYAEERDGWLWVTTEQGFNRLPRDPKEAFPDKKYRNGEVFWAWLDKTQLTPEDRAQIRATAQVAAKQWMTSSSWEIPAMAGRKLQELSDKQSSFIHDTDKAELWLCQEVTSRIPSDIGPTKLGTTAADFVFTRRAYTLKSDGTFRRADRKYRITSSMIAWCIKASLEYDKAAEEQRFGPILEIPREIFDIEF
ncbi:MAG: hypothetical protein Q4G68_04645 [Planctomycetia bacterium]|nr:hypothetical protein [Planctomycetia bacterium]